MDEVLLYLDFWKNFLRKIAFQPLSKIKSVDFLFFVLTMQIWFWPHISTYHKELRVLKKFRFEKSHSWQKISAGRSQFLPNISLRKIYQKILNSQKFDPRKENLPFLFFYRAQLKNLTQIKILNWYFFLRNK